jgi:hypothetical protein
VIPVLRRFARPAAIAVLALVLLVAVVSGDRDRPSEPRQTSADAVSVDHSDASSSAWYCAAGGLGIQTVRITNLGDEALDAVVRVLPGRDEPPAALEIEVEPISTEAVLIADVLSTSEPGVVVETFGGDSFVEHELRAGDDVALGPCATTAAAQWHFAGGSTLQGARQFLVLFNPFADDSSVDISFVTEAGFAQPERLQGFTVPRRSRVAIPIHDEITRAELVATSVTTRIGRIVAEQVLVLDGSDTVGGREGIALSLGAMSAEEEWSFPWAGPVGGSDFGIAVANFGTDAGELTVSIALDGEATLEDQSVPIPPRAVIFVDLAARVPAELGASVTLRTSGGVAVVAEQLVADEGRLATTLGRRGGASRWVFSSAGRAIALYNRGGDHVDVVVRSASGEELTNVEIAGRDRLEITRAELGDPEGPVIVEATAPVLAARIGTLTVSAGVVGR